MTKMLESSELLENDAAVFSMYSSHMMEEYEVLHDSESSVLENECAHALLELAHSFVSSSYDSSDDFNASLESKRFSHEYSVSYISDDSSECVIAPPVPTHTIKDDVLSLESFGNLNSEIDFSDSVVKLDHCYARKFIIDSKILLGEAAEKRTTLSPKKLKCRLREKSTNSCGKTHFGFPQTNSNLDLMSYETAIASSGSMLTNEGVAEFASTQGHTVPKNRSKLRSKRPPFPESTERDVSNRKTRKVAGHQV